MARCWEMASSIWESQPSVRAVSTSVGSALPGAMSSV